MALNFPASPLLNDEYTSNGITWRFDGVAWNVVSGGGGGGGGGGGDYSNVDVDTHLNTATASINEVLSWSGSDYAWTANGSGGGGGIALTDLSVTVEAAGTANLTYNNTTGVFSYTPPDLSALGGGGSSNFSDLGDVTFANLTIDKIYEPAIAMLRLDNVGTSAYTFNSHYAGNNPTLLVLSGATIAFDLDEIPGHPFQIQDSAGDPYNVGLVHVSSAGIVTTGLAAQNRSSGTLYWRVPETIFGTYRYQCNSHAAMFGPITIKRLSSI